MSYINEFFRLRCSKDILDILQPIRNLDKELTEAMGIIRRIKELETKNITIIDMCSGNALVPVISAFLLPDIKYTIAIDKYRREREWNKINKFCYIQENIYNIFPKVINDWNPCIITASHPCSRLANRIIDLYNNSNAHALILIPCCIGNLENKIPHIIERKIGKYMSWCWQLADKCNGTIYKDNNILSPKNIIVKAMKPVYYTTTTS